MGRLFRVFAPPEPAPSHALPNFQSLPFLANATLGATGPGQPHDLRRNTTASGLAGDVAPFPQKGWPILPIGLPAPVLGKDRR